MPNSDPTVAGVSSPYLTRRNESGLYTHHLNSPLAQGNSNVFSASFIEVMDQEGKGWTRAHGVLGGWDLKICYNKPKDEVLT